MIYSILTIIIVILVLIVGWFIFKSIMKFIMFFFTLVLIVLLIFGILAYMDYKTLSHVYDDSEKLVLLQKDGDIQLGFETMELWINEDIIMNMADPENNNFRFVDDDTLELYSSELKSKGSLDYKGEVLVFNLDNLKRLDVPTEGITSILEGYINSNQVDIFADYMAVGWITKKVMVTKFVGEVKEGNIIMIPGLNVLKVSKKLPAFITKKIEELKND